jgi:hypothetical protein
LSTDSMATAGGGAGEVSVLSVAIGAVGVADTLVQDRSAYGCWLDS